MDMLRMHSDGQHLICKNCLERKPAEKKSTGIKPKSPAMVSPAPKKTSTGTDKDITYYFCSACRYNFKRASRLVIERCPYCDAQGSLKVKDKLAL